MTAALNAAARYQRVQTETVSPVKLVSMLLDGADRFAREAEEALSTGDRARVGDRISRCHAVIEELAASLDHEKAPELCDNLLGVYTFCMHQLVEANRTRDPALLAEVRRVLQPIREAWAQLSTTP